MNPSETPAAPPAPMNCSFCGKDHKKAASIIAGPSVFICNECVDCCSTILDEKEVPRNVSSFQTWRAAFDEFSKALVERAVFPFDDSKAIAIVNFADQLAKLTVVRINERWTEAKEAKPKVSDGAPGPV
jgi:ATP-dependent Clp protease ATP-binding subunit ClpX